jgi:actin
MEKIWHHLFYSELRINPGEVSVVLIEPIFNPKINQERTAEILFETFEVPGINMALAPVLSIYCHGRTTGLVVECGT